MATKPTTKLYNEYELQFLERKLKELDQYIEARPFQDLEDRYGTRMGKYGPVEYVIQTIEAQRKDLTAALKEYAEITKLIGAMREEEERKIEARGGGDIPSIAKQYLKK